MRLKTNLNFLTVWGETFSPTACHVANQLSYQLRQPSSMASLSLASAWSRTHNLRTPGLVTNSYYFVQMNSFQKSMFLNSCKKKHVLYKQLVKCRMEETENKYKKYKNRWATIMRNKKNYYNKLLEIHKSNTQGKWKVSSNRINKSLSKIIFWQINKM